MTDLFTTKVAIYGPRLAKEFGLTDVQAAGVFGNVGHECAGFVLLQEVRPAVAGSRGGYGWCQWTGPRRVAFEAWCKAHRLPPASDEANYGFLAFELHGPEAGAITVLRKTIALSAATDAFCRAFERPGVVSLPSRMTWANKALDAIRITTTPVPAEPPATTTPLTHRATATPATAVSAPLTPSVPTPPFVEAAPVPGSMVIIPAKPAPTWLERVRIWLAA